MVLEEEGDYYLLPIDVKYHDPIAELKNNKRLGVAMVGYSRNETNEEIIDSLKK
jgi:hypothetical protein